MVVGGGPVLHRRLVLYASNQTRSKPSLWREGEREVRSLTFGHVSGRRSSVAEAESGEAGLDRTKVFNLDQTEAGMQRAAAIGCHRESGHKAARAPSTREWSG